MYECIISECNCARGNLGLGLHTSKSVEKTLGMHLHTLDTGSLHPPHVLTNPEEEGEREGREEWREEGRGGEIWKESAAYRREWRQGRRRERGRRDNTVR